MSIATIESNTEESMIGEMEAEKQIRPTFSIPTKVKLITTKSPTVPLIGISEEKFWMVSKELIEQRQIQIKHWATRRVAPRFTP